MVYTNWFDGSLSNFNLLTVVTSYLYSFPISNVSFRIVKVFSVAFAIVTLELSEVFI